MKTGFRGTAGGNLLAIYQTRKQDWLGCVGNEWFLAGALFWGSFNYGWKKRMRKSSVFPAIR